MTVKRFARRNAAGFTLIELLVVIAIIAVLIGLLIPAVQKVRAAAARISCGNNLKQLGLAMHMYEDGNQVLPPGWVTGPTGSPAPSPGWAWSLLILPYIEQGNLYSTINPDITVAMAPNFTANPAQATALQTPVKTLVCPADVQSPLNTVYGNQGPAPQEQVAKINYVCNRTLLGPDSSSRATPMTIQGIHDGSSQTILLGERDMTVGVGALFAIRGSTTASFEGRPGTGLNPLPASGTYNTGSIQRLDFSSMHSGGCNFVFADGSVHFIQNSIPADPNDAFNFPVNTTNYPFQNLINPNDGFVVNYPY
jgi:prepilin-type N-terminal cleavage/methylation domain-containing protein/prepilin-type processing-associated H-X9-DG protein